MDATAPLYGRAQCILRLQPRRVTEIAAALELRDAVAAVEAYATFGGIPRYWALVRELGSDTRHALERLVLSPYGVLHEEAERVLRDEEATMLERALCAMIGSGVHRPSELAGRLGIRETTLAKPLRHLVELGVVRRDAPYELHTGKPAVGGRRSFYCLADPFLGMWYACVRPHVSGLNMAACAARDHTLDAWRHRVASVWEDICREQWHYLHLDGTTWEPAGRYREGRAAGASEWDVVSVLVDRSRVFVGECKWQRHATRARAAVVP